MSEQPPQILRIKRKRHQDPLQALILEDKRLAKRSKPSTPVGSPTSSPKIAPRKSQEHLNYVFKLTRTDDTVNIQDESIVNSILAESESVNTEVDARNFVIPKHQIEEDVVIPNELSDMVNSVLTFDKPTTQRKKRGHKGVQEEPAEVHPEAQEPEHDAEADDSQYVYDVYQLSMAEPLTSANHPQSLIGYIRFFDDDENDENILMNDEDNDSVKPDLTDDEDSNTESFYQNDYPSDEDAGAFSDVYDENEDEGYVPQEGVGLRDDEYFDYDEVDFHNVIDDGDDEEDDDEDTSGFKRNTFFKGDQDDPMAIYRDKIFGKLERMIDE
ncbi:uncharacterized protein SPAPADRAFT_144096 [Spathaspora passalidarum NRRL Y-27907]|uniref:Transcription factor Iwr1 domain-containing protein n=1 Tax=Spathaspora passalidarum (strain NRRL Y-27907 / 11-Y1) TaxID=619300 RepID=G3AVF6_SPAPN|nr:uncharacterized protein SPAPADRAFT_144096 [Spathaspora passalidarum NRRL Y-27907]EGW30175.1 hypothetical protein SPAPADRAFT_144096 [Spathaspora passalidarum NRRL Y-27907]